MRKTGEQQSNLYIYMYMFFLLHLLGKSRGFQQALNSPSLAYEAGNPASSAGRDHDVDVGR